MNRRRVSVLSALVTLLLLVTGFIVSSAQASTTNIVNIPSGLDACKGVEQNVGLTKHEGGFEGGVYNTFGKSYPVILVHGLDGKNQGQWGDLDQSTDLAARIDNIPNAVVATEFQYNTVSVRIQGRPIGDVAFTTHVQPLANTIDCLATISRGNGGPGKVIIVGYSEGSALAHAAASTLMRNDWHVAGDEIGQAVTIADARTVFGWWPLFPANDFPSNVTVHSIGGNLKNVVRSSDGSYTREQVTRSDGVVSLSDAISQSTEDEGGGTHVTSCFQVYARYSAWLGYTGRENSPTCEHGNLLRNSEETQWDIVDAITAFVNAHCTGAEPNSGPTTNLAAAAVPMADKTSPAPTPTPTDPGTPGTPGVPSGDPTSVPSQPPTTPPSGCVA